MFRKKLSKELRKARDAYFLQMFSFFMNYSKKLCNKLNALMNRNQISDPIEKISLNGRLLVKDDLANAFYDYFVHRDVDLSHPMPRIMCTLLQTQYFFQPLMPSDVCSVYLRLKTSRSCDADGLQILPMKFVICDIAPISTRIYNLCISTAYFQKI